MTPEKAVSVEHDLDQLIARLAAARRRATALGDAAKQAYEAAQGADADAYDCEVALRAEIGRRVEQATAKL